MDELREAASADAFLGIACAGRIATITLSRPARRIGLPRGLSRARTHLIPSFRSHLRQMTAGLFLGQKGAGPAARRDACREGVDVLWEKGSIETVARAAGGARATAL